MIKKKRRRKRKKKSELHSKILNVVLAPELKEAVQMAAFECGIKSTQYVRNLIEKDVKSKMKSL